jgi:hypothetical protein
MAEKRRFNELLSNLERSAGMCGRCAACRRPIEPRDEFDLLQGEVIHANCGRYKRPERRKRHDGPVAAVWGLFGRRSLRA